MEPQLFTLKNGLRVILIDTKTFPSLTTLLLFDAGSRYENKENNGIAHFLEHMPFKGTKKYPDAFAISSTIEGLGGVFNAFTSKDYTGFWIKGTADHFDTEIDVLADLIQHPLLDPTEIEREKGVIVEEINMYEDMPQDQVGNLFENLIYSGNSLGFDTIGTKKTVRSFTRETFLDYLKRFYVATNAVLIVAGGFSSANSNGRTFKSYLELIEKKFGSWTTGVKGKIVMAEDHQEKPQILIRKKNTEQAHFCLGFPAFSFFDPRKYTLSVLSAILGGGASSRLFMELREKRGLCYYIGTGRQLYQDVGNVVTQAGVPKELDKVREAVEVILEIHQEFKRGKLKKEDMERAKEQLKGRMLLSMEDSFNVAHFFGKKKVLENKMGTIQEEISKLKAVTYDEIIALSQELFKLEKLNFTIIGPFEENAIKTEDFSL